MITLAEVMKNVADSISRKKGTFDLVRAPIRVVPKMPDSPFILAAGSFRTIKIPGGFIVCLGLTRTQVEGLRDRCNELLGS